MKFEIHNHEGAGPLRFGMTTEEVREAVGEEFESFKKDPDSDDHPIDYFEKVGCSVSYDQDGKVDAIEFSEPGQPTIDGVDLLGLGFGELLELITGLDPDVEVQGGEGFRSTSLGVGSWAPNGEDEPESPAEAVIVFRRGYYEE